MSPRKKLDARSQVIADLVQRRIDRMTPQEHRIAALRRQTPQKYALDRLGGAVELHAALKQKRRNDTRHRERADEEWRNRARRHLELLVNTKNVPRPDALLKVAAKFHKSLDTVRKATVGVAKSRR